MAADLSGRRVLVVEDEYFIAADIVRTLAEAGIEVVGPCGQVGDSLGLADQPLDAALLDVNLGGSPSFPVADRQAERNVPFMFLTGYDSWAIPEEYEAIPRLTKPFLMRKVVSAVEQLVTPP